jgi:1-acyl-sn-glycerol-3-phosphate acyltransferase
VGLLAPLLYRTFRGIGRFIFFCTMNVRVRRPTAAVPGPYVLAVTHLSHLEPFIASIVMRRDVDWIARHEFYRRRWISALLYGVHCIPVRRDGVPVSTIRTALERLARGRIVGIFPEGGVSRGRNSACVGGPIRFGGCVIAARAGVPVVPCVILGAHELLKVGPWLPAKRGHLWVAFGEPIAPPPQLADTVAARRLQYRAMGEQLRDAYKHLYEDLVSTYALGDQTGDTYAEPLTASAGVAPPASESVAT